MVSCRNQTESTAPLTTTTKEVMTISKEVSQLSNEHNIALFITETPTTSMGINFELASDSDGYVEYGIQYSNEFHRIKANQKITPVGRKTAFLYEAEMSPLIPGETYQYRVVNADDTERSQYYTFSMPEEQQSEFTFMYLADPQENAETGYMAYAFSILNVLDYSQQDFDFVVYPGDIVNDADVRTQWNLFFKYSSIFSYNKPIVATSGNHDVAGISRDQVNQLEFDGYMNFPNNGPVYEAFDEITGDNRASHFDDGKTYSFDYQNAHFLIINSETFCDGTTTCANQDESNVGILTDWIRADLENNNQKWTIVVLHRSPYSLSYNNEKIREDLVPLLDEYQVDLVIGGHDHQYSRAVYSGGEMVTFKRSNDYLKGTISLIQDQEQDYHFNNYSSNLGVTYFNTNTSSTKFYGGDKSSGIDVNYRYIDENPVIPMITISENTLQVISYGLSKETGLSIVPSGVYILEQFLIEKSE